MTVSKNGNEDAEDEKVLCGLQGSHDDTCRRAAAHVIFCCIRGAIVSVLWRSSIEEAFIVCSFNNTVIGWKTKFRKVDNLDVGVRLVIDVVVTVLVVPTHCKVVKSPSLFRVLVDKLVFDWNPHVELLEVLVKWWPRFLLIPDVLLV